MKLSSLACQVFHENLHWDAESQIGSMENLNYQPASRQQKVESFKFDIFH